MGAPRWTETSIYPGHRAGFQALENAFGNPNFRGGRVPRGRGAPQNLIKEDHCMEFSLFPRDVFAELDRLQREMQQAFEFSPSIRGVGRRGYPALNVGGTPQSVEIYVFAAGLAPAAMDVKLEKGVLSIAGERKN